MVWSYQILRRKKRINHEQHYDSSFIASEYLETMGVAKRGWHHYQYNILRSMLKTTLQAELLMKREIISLRRTKM
ncbi:hypothetical protein V1478_010698 [Vespula squamosa]|uniref:Uncharacterized protein n=1 Tax=Vespula squamosa TaxID=30214 RepID=A0ABD2AIH4_VESSQ